MTTQYFGPPYAHSFALPLPLDDCVELIARQHGRRLRRILKSKGSPGVFDVVMELNEIDGTQVDFQAYAEYKAFNLFKFKQNTRIYGNVYLYGQCRWEGYQTIIEYDFYHKNDKPFQYDMMPAFLYEFFRRTAYIVLFVGALILVFLIPLSSSILTEGLGVSDMFSVLSGFTFFGGFIFLIFLSSLHEGIYPVIQLDNLMRKTFQERGYSVLAGTRKKQSTDFYLPE